MFNKAPGIGLDIGSKKIKLVELTKKKNGFELIKFGSLLTPPGMLEGGVILDPEVLGKEMEPMVKELKLKGKAVVSAVSGQQVYTRALVMPAMPMGELREAVYYQATGFLPIPVEEAVIDIFPLRDFEDEEGKQTEVFFVAVRKEQVENLDASCQIAGLKLAAVEIEPLAIQRILKGQDELRVKGYLNIGASRSYFSVFVEGLLVYYRSLAFGCSAFYETSGMNNTLSGLDEVEIAPDNQYDYLVKDILAEVSRSAEYYTMQYAYEKIEKILICGGGSRLRGLDQRLADYMGYVVEIANPLTDLGKTNNLNLDEENELRHDFVVALGLAAREKI